MDDSTFILSGNRSARTCSAFSIEASEPFMSSQPSLVFQLLRTVATVYHTLCGPQVLLPRVNAISTWPESCLPCQTSDWVEASVQDVHNTWNLRQQQIKKGRGCFPWARVWYTIWRLVSSRHTTPPVLHKAPHRSPVSDPSHA